MKHNKLYLVARRVIYGSFRAAVTKLCAKSVQEKSKVSEVIRLLKDQMPMSGRTWPSVSAKRSKPHKTIGVRQIVDVPEFVMLLEENRLYYFGEQDCLHVNVELYEVNLVVDRVLAQLNQRLNGDMDPYKLVVVHNNEETVPQGATWYFPNVAEETPYLLPMRKY